MNPFLVGILSWWGVSALLGMSAVALLGPARDSGGPYTTRQGWGLLLGGVAIGWFLRGPVGP